jgi:predicted nucleotidyltransferase
LEPFLRLASALDQANVRFVVIGVAGANQYARSAGSIFTTEDFDLFLPANAGNAILAWRACENMGLELWCGSEPLDSPRDEFLAEQIVSRRALVRVEGPDLRVDLTLVMAGFEFEAVWLRRRVFRSEGVEVPVARLSDIVASKAAAGRPKDRLFLATHEESLRTLMRRESE